MPRIDGREDALVPLDVEVAVARGLPEAAARDVDGVQRAARRDVELVGGDAHDGPVAGVQRVDDAGFGAEVRVRVEPEGRRAGEGRAGEGSERVEVQAVEEEGEEGEEGKEGECQEGGPDGCCGEEGGEN